MHEEVLEWVNRERLARGIGPALEQMPKGLLASGENCSLARALGPDVFVGGHEAIYNFMDPDNEDIEDLPECVRWFVCGFDRGYYPELVDAA